MNLFFGSKNERYIFNEKLLFELLQEKLATNTIQQPVYEPAIRNPKKRFFFVHQKSDLQLFMLEFCLKISTFCSPQKKEISFLLARKYFRLAKNTFYLRYERSDSNE